MPEFMSSSPPSQPTEYVVSDAKGLSSDDIAKALGNPQAARGIELAAGVTSGETMKPGTRVLIPSQQANFSMALDTTPSSQIIATLIGSLSPQILLQQHQQQKHRSCMKTILLVAISVFVSLVAPPLAGLILGAVATGTGVLASILVGITAAALDSAFQGILIGMHVINRYSFAEALECGVQAGLSHLMQMDDLMSKFKSPVTLAATRVQLFARIVTMEAAINFAQQATGMLMQEQQKMDLRLLLASAVDGALDLGFNAEGFPMSMSKNAHHLLAFAYKDIIETATGAAITGTSMSNAFA